MRKCSVAERHDKRQSTRSGIGTVTVNDLENTGDELTVDRTVTGMLVITVMIGLRLSRIKVW
jgi:hypothetical protein